MPRIYVLTFSNIYCILSVDKGGIKNMNSNLKMSLSSSDGTNLTIEELEKTL